MRNQQRSLKGILRFDVANLMHCKHCIIFMLYTFKRQLLHLIVSHQERPHHCCCWSTVTLTGSSEL